MARRRPELYRQGELLSRERPRSQARLPELDSRSHRPPQWHRFVRSCAAPPGPPWAPRRQQTHSSPRRGGRTGLIGPPPEGAASHIWLMGAPLEVAYVRSRACIERASAIAGLRTSLTPTMLNPADCSMAGVPSFASDQLGESAAILRIAPSRDADWMWPRIIRRMERVHERRLGIRPMGTCSHRDQVRDPDDVVQPANSSLGFPALIRILDHPREGDPALVSLHQDGPLWGVRMPGNHNASSACDLIIACSPACLRDGDGWHNRADPFHAPDGLLDCCFFGSAGHTAGEGCEPILDRNPDPSRVDARLAIEHVNEGSAKQLVVHRPSPSATSRLARSPGQGQSEAAARDEQ